MRNKQTMKKKFYCIICICSLVSMLLYAYKNSTVESLSTTETNEEDNETVTFQATVTELIGSNILVEPLEGSLELSSSDSFSIPNIDTIDLHIGDTVEITYNGVILESYPTQLGKVYDIKIIKEFTSSQSQTESSAMNAYEKKSLVTVSKSEKKFAC